MKHHRQYNKKRIQWHESLKIGRLQVSLSIFVSFVKYMSYFCFLGFAYILIGIPVKPPVLTIDGTKIIVSKTKVSELLDSGFDIYIR